MHTNGLASPPGLQSPFLGNPTNEFLDIQESAFRIRLIFLENGTPLTRRCCHTETFRKWSVPGWPLTAPVLVY